MLLGKKVVMGKFNKIILHGITILKKKPTYAYSGIILLFFPFTRYYRINNMQMLSYCKVCINTHTENSNSQHMTFDIHFHIRQWLSKFQSMEIPYC